MKTSPSVKSFVELDVSLNALLPVLNLYIGTTFLCDGIMKTPEILPAASVSRPPPITPLSFLVDRVTYLEQ